MDVFEIIFAHFLFELIGAGLRYFYNTMLFLFGNKGYIEFSTYWKVIGSIDKKNDNEMRNSLIGTIFVISIVVLLVLFNLLCY